MLQRTETLLLPGYGNSGPGHWQSIWESTDDSFKRIMQDDWDYPVLAEWSARLEEVTAAMNHSFSIAAHSLGCLLVAHWARKSTNVNKVKGALLVAIPDPHRPSFPAAIRGFSEVPEERLPFPSIVVASIDDPYANMLYASRCAEDWGSRFVNVGSKGHINASSGLGSWQTGKELLKSFNK